MGVETDSLSPQVLVEYWLRYRPLLDSEMLVVDAAWEREKEVAEIILGEFQEYLEARSGDDLEASRMELGDVVFGLLVSAAIRGTLETRRSGRINFDEIPTQHGSEPELVENLEAAINSHHDAMVDRKIIQAANSAQRAISACKGIAELNTWDLYQTITDVAEKNTINYVTGLFISGWSPFTNRKDSQTFLRIFRTDPHNFKRFVGSLFRSLDSNDLWFLSGHSDGDIYREHVYHGLEFIIGSGNFTPDQVQVAKNLLEIGDWTRTRVHC